MSSMDSYDDDNFGKPKKSGALWGAIIAGVVVVGAAGYYFMQGEAPEETPTEAGPVKVIGGSEVPPDTQGPKAAKGKNVDSSSGTVFKEGSPRPNGHRPSGNGSSKKKKKDQVKITKTDDPLAGLD